MEFRVYNKNLDNNIWDDNKELRPDVHAALMRIVRDYYDNTKEIEGALTDAWIVGSSANYNWAPGSDLDLHLVVDGDKIVKDEELVRSLLELLSHKWNQSHTIDIKGHKVELYLQDINHKLHSSGIYSLMDDKWVDEPTPEKVTIDELQIKQKYKNTVEKIEKAIVSKDVKKMKDVLEDIREKRRTGLDRSGEFSSENIVFKMLRKFGYIEKLKKASNDAYDRELSLTEGLENPDDLIIGYVTPSLKVAMKTSTEAPDGHASWSGVNWNNVAAFRYRADRGELYWWNDYRNYDNPDIRDAAEEALREKYGFTRFKHKAICVDSSDGDTGFKIAHGIEEMATVSQIGKTAMVGPEKLKGMPVEKVQGNIVIFRQPTPNDFIPEGFTWVYFMDTDENAELMRKGEIPMISVPRGTFYSGGNPITDIWKKKFQKPGTEHILGHIEGNTDADEIFIDMITVRPGWQRNHIGKLMVDSLKKLYPSAKINTSGKTEKGEKFFKGINENDWKSAPESELLELVSEAREQLRDMISVADDSVADFVLDLQTAAKFCDKALTTQDRLDIFKALQKAHDVLEVEYDETPPDEEHDSLVDRINNVINESTAKQQWITGITDENLNTVSEKYSGNINNVTHRHLEAKYHIDGDVGIRWRYVYDGEFLNYWDSPTDEQKTEIMFHLGEKYDIHGVKFVHYLSSVRR